MKHILKLLDHHHTAIHFSFDSQLLILQHVDRATILVRPLILDSLWNFSKKVALVLLRTIIKQCRRVLSQLARRQNHTEEQVFFLCSRSKEAPVNPLIRSSHRILDRRIWNRTRWEKFNACILSHFGIVTTHVLFVG